MIPSLEGWPTKVKEAPSPHEVRMSPLDTNRVFQSLGGSSIVGYCCSIVGYYELFNVSIICCLIEVPWKLLSYRVWMFLAKIFHMNFPCRSFTFLVRGSMLRCLNSIVRIERFMHLSILSKYLLGAPLHASVPYSI